MKKISLPLVIIYIITLVLFAALLEGCWSSYDEGTWYAEITRFPAPTVFSIDPQSGYRGETLVPVTVVGRNFHRERSTIPRVELRKDNYDIQAKDETLVFANSIACRVDVPLDAPVGSYDLAVVNPDGQEGVLSCFEVREETGVEEEPEQKEPGPWAQAPVKTPGAYKWLLCEGSTGGGFDTWVLIANAGEKDAEVEVNFLNQDGPVATEELTLISKSRTTIHVNEYVKDDFQVSVEIESDEPVVAERSMYWDKREYPAIQPYEMRGGHANLGAITEEGVSATGAAEAATTTYFPEGATAGGFDTWILLTNPNDEEAKVEVSYMGAKGLMNEEHTRVSPRSRATVHLNEKVANSFEVATEISSDIPIVCERSMYWDKDRASLNPYEMRGGHSNSGSSTPQTEWYLAEGSTGGGFETYILMQNPQTEEVKTKVTFMNESGIAEEEEIVMPAKSRRTIKASDHVKDEFNLSTKVTSDKPIVVERSMYWDKREANSPYEMKDGHATRGVSQTAKIWTIAEGSTGGYFDSWVLLANPNDTNAEVQVTFLTEEGPKEPEDIKVPANSRRTIRVSDFVANQFGVGCLVSSDKPIVAERSMYWDPDSGRAPYGGGRNPYEMRGGHSSLGISP